MLGRYDGNGAKYWRNQQNDTSVVTRHVCRSIDKQEYERPQTVRTSVFDKLNPFKLQDGRAVYKI